MAEDNRSNGKQEDQKQVIPKKSYKRKRREFFHNAEREQRVQNEKEEKAQQKEKEAMQAKNNEERVKDNLRKARIEKLTQEEIQHQNEQAQKPKKQDSKTTDKAMQEEEGHAEQTEQAPVKEKQSKSSDSLHNKSDKTSKKKAEPKNTAVANETAEHEENQDELGKQEDVHYQHSGGFIPPIKDDGSDARHDKEHPRAAFIQKHWAKVMIIVGVVILLLLLFAIFHNMQSDKNNESGALSSFTGSNDKKQTAMMKAADSTIHSVVTVENKAKRNSSVDKETAKSDNEIGSGVVYKKVDDSIFILTNAHVVGNKDTQRILYDDSKETTGKVIGKDKYSDIAVVKAKVKSNSNVKPIKIGDSNQLQLAEPVIVVGNPLGVDFKGSVSSGIVSGLNRNVPVDINKDGTYDNLSKAFQIDAPVNPGNSGGAVVDSNGKLIGIVSLKIDMPAVEGMAFAIPVNQAMNLAKELEKKGHITYPNTGVALSNVAELSENERHQFNLPNNLDYGAVVREVNANSDAEKSGLKTGDVIVKLDGKKVEDNLRYRQIIFEHKDDLKALSAEIYRNGKLKSITIKLK